jgi:hypothetical protein
MVKKLTTVYTLVKKTGRGRSMRVKELVIESKILIGEDTRITWAEPNITENGDIEDGICNIKIDGDSFRVKHSLEELEDIMNGNLRNLKVAGFKATKDPINHSTDIHSDRTNEKPI